MIFTVDLQAGKLPFSGSGEQFEMAAGVTPVGGHTLVTADTESGVVEYDIPGVTELTPEQQEGLTALAPIAAGWPEKTPGLAGYMLAHGGLIAGKRAMMKDMISELSPSDPLVGLLYLIVRIVNEAENYGRANPGLAATTTPTLEQVLEYAKMRIDQGDADCM